MVDQKKISTTLTAAFRGYITRVYIQIVCGNINPDWVRNYTYTDGNNSKSKISKHKNRNNMLSEELSQQDQQYIEAHEKRN
jgi:hypothetical protein